MQRPLVIDGYCGLGGWSEGFLAEGWECIGIDIERHDYATGGYGSFYLWGDVPALMPVPHKARKVPGSRFDGSGGSFHTAAVEVTKVAGVGAGWKHPSDPRHVPGLAFNTLAERATKTIAHVNRQDGHTRHLTNQAEHDAVKQAGISGPRDNGKGDAWFQDGAAKHRSKSSARKAASARIAKIPFRLAKFIAAFYKPEGSK